jgi:hypothetical protein
MDAADGPTVCGPIMECVVVPVLAVLRAFFAGLVVAAMVWGEPSWVLSPNPSFESVSGTLF